jgi:hypothetical protein
LAGNHKGFYFYNAVNDEQGKRKNGIIYASEGRYVEKTSSPSLMYEKGHAALEIIYR